MIIKILLFGHFGGDRELVERNFGRAELLDHEAPLGSFVNSSFKSLAAEADIALHGGEPKYKPYITAAKKGNCKLALWGCEAEWISRCHAVLPLFDLIFAKDKTAFAALREAGYQNVVLPKSGAGDAEEQAPVEEQIPAEKQVPAEERATAEKAAAPLLSAAALPKLEIPDIEPLPEGAAPTSIRFASGIHAYGVVNRNDNVRAVSAAGGVFTLLCEEIIGKGGVVFGARYNNKFGTVHAKADRMPECAPMRGVKYAFGDTEGIYAQAVSCLHQGKHVLFTGTPCQVYRLYAHLPPRRPDHPNLITAGVVCGGAVEPDVFAAYLKYVEEKNGASATAVDMSGKPMGSGKPVVRIGSENGTYEVPVSRDPFIRGYRAGLFLRGECYNCPHHDERRKNDLTLAGFPGGRKHIPELYDNKGASLVLAHTQKGRDMMDALVRRAIVREIPPDALTDYNAAIVEVPAKHHNHDLFAEDVRNMRFDKAVARSIGPAVWGILTANKRILTIWEKLTKR
jgi:hypothetical protein